MKNKKLKLFIGLIIGGVLVLVWLQLVDTRGMWEQLKTIRWAAIPILIALFFIRYYIKAWRWQIILAPIKKIRINEAFYFSMASYFINYIFPVHIGEVGQSYLLKKSHNVSVGESLPTIFLGKGFEILRFLILFILILIFPTALNPFIFWGLVVILLLVLILMMLLLLSVFRKEAAIRLLKKLLFWVPGKFRKKGEKFMENFVAGVNVIRRLPGKWAGLIILTLAGIFFDTLFIWVIFWAVGFAAPFVVVFMGSQIRQLFFALPMPPGQLGSAEILLYLIYEVSFGFDPNIVAAATALAHVGAFFLLSATGLYSLTKIGMSLKGIWKKL